MPPRQIQRQNLSWQQRHSPPPPLSARRKPLDIVPLMNDRFPMDNETPSPWRSPSSERTEAEIKESLQRLLEAWPDAFDKDGYFIAPPMELVRGYTREMQAAEEPERLDREYLEYWRQEMEKCRRELEAARAMKASQTTPPSPPPAATSGEWTPERLERMRVQDEASARIRRALGRVVTPPTDTPPSPREEG